MQLSSSSVPVSLRLLNSTSITHSNSDRLSGGDEASPDGVAFLTHVKTQVEELLRRCQTPPSKPLAESVSLSSPSFSVLPTDSAVVPDCDDLPSSQEALSVSVKNQNPSSGVAPSVSLSSPSEASPEEVSLSPEASLSREQSERASLVEVEVRLRAAATPLLPAKVACVFSVAKRTGLFCGCMRSCVWRRTTLEGAVVSWRKRKFALLFKRTPLPLCRRRLLPSPSTDTVRGLRSALLVFHTEIGDDFEGLSSHRTQHAGAVRNSHYQQSPL